MAKPSPRKVHRRKKVVHRRKRRVDKPKRTPSTVGNRSSDGNQAGHDGKKSTGNRLFPSENPQEEQNVFENTKMPAGYCFVPKGDVYITRQCRLKTKASDRIVYKIYNKTGKRSLGIRVPLDVYQEVLNLSKQTEESRAVATKARDAKFLDQGRQLLKEQFPFMPEETLDTILEHAFCKGSGRVGRTGTISDSHKAQLAVEAHVRHEYTPYEQLLAGGMERPAARKKVWDTVQAVRRAWEGKESKNSECLPLRIG